MSCTSELQNAQNNLQNAKDEYAKKVKEANYASNAADLFRIIMTSDSATASQKEDAKIAYGIISGTGSFQGKEKPAWYDQAVKMGQDGDATSIAQMKDALTLFEKFIEYRQEKSLPVPKINLTSIAVAMLDADYATNVERSHSYYYESDENLAWPGANPARDSVSLWAEEQQIWDKAVANDPSLAPYLQDAYGLSEKHPDFYSTVGHYLNLMNKSVVAYGAATTSNTGAYDANVNSAHYTMAKEGLYTLDQYKNLITKYTIEPIEKDPAVMAAQAAVSTATKRNNQVEGEVNNKKTTHDTAANLVDALTKQLNETEINLKNKQLDLANSKKVLEQKENSLQGQRENLKNETNKLAQFNESSKKAQDLLSAEKDKQVAAKSNAEKIKENLSVTKQKLSSLQSTLVSMQTNQDKVKKAQDKLNTAKSNLADAQQELAKQQKHLAELKATHSQRQKDVDAAKTAVAKATEDVNDAKKALQEAKDALVEAKKTDADRYGSLVKIEPVTVVVGQEIPDPVIANDGIVVSTPAVQSFMLMSLPVVTPQAAGQLPDGTNAEWADREKVERDAKTVGSYDEDVLVTFPDKSTYKVKGVHLIVNPVTKPDDNKPAGDKTPTGEPSTTPTPGKDDTPTKTPSQQPGKDGEDKGSANQPGKDDVPTTTPSNGTETPSNTPDHNDGNSAKPGDNKPAGGKTPTGEPSTTPTPGKDDMPTKTPSEQPGKDDDKGSANQPGKDDGTSTIPSNGTETPSSTPDHNDGNSAKPGDNKPAGDKAPSGEPSTTPTPGKDDTPTKTPFKQPNNGDNDKGSTNQPGKGNGTVTTPSKDTTPGTEAPSQQPTNDGNNGSASQTGKDANGSTNTASTEQPAATNHGTGATTTAPADSKPAPSVNKDTGSSAKAPSMSKGQAGIDHSQMLNDDEMQNISTEPAANKKGVAVANTNMVKSTSAAQTPITGANAMPTREQFKASQQNKQLPQTGNSRSSLLTLAGIGLAAAASLFGLSLKKREN